MRPRNMRSFAVPLAAVVAAAAVTSACASSSRSVVTAGGSPASAAVSSTPSTAATSSAAATASTAASAALDYTPPAGSSGGKVHKSVVGATYQRLAADLAALKPVPDGSAMCNVLNGESATITVTSAGSTKVFVVAGTPCRGVRLTENGKAQPLLAGSITLLTQIRAIAGTSGLAHPLGTS